MLIDGFYIEEIKGVFCAVPSEKLEVILSENAVEKFKNKNMDFKIDTFMSFKEEFFKEKGQDYFNALLQVLRSKYHTKKYVESMIKENAKVCTYGSTEEKERAFTENRKLYDIEKYILI